MKTSEAIKGREAEILSYYGLPPITGNRHYKGECPLCGKKSKFRLNNSGGNVGYICVCGNGSLLSLIGEVTGKDFSVYAKEIDDLIGNNERPAGGFQKQINSTPKHIVAVERFKLLHPVKGSPIQEYLAGRGIYDLPARGVRFDEKLNYGHPSMLALATDESFNACYAHRTLLNGDQKADHEKVKTWLALQDKEKLEFARSVAIRLSSSAETLGIAEGIETAISAKIIYGANTWSVLSTALMKKFKAPLGVRHLMIFADNDSNGAGLAAAFECGNKNILSNNSVELVTVRWPATVPDFNDMLLEGSEVYEWELKR